MVVSALVFFLLSSHFHVLSTLWGLGPLWDQRVFCSPSHYKGSQSCFGFPNQNPEGSNSHVYSFQYTNPIDLRNPLSDSVHGLILLRGFKLWNPSLRRVLALPDHTKHMPGHWEGRTLSEVSIRAASSHIPSISHLSRFPPHFIEWSC